MRSTHHPHCLVWLWPVLLGLLSVGPAQAEPLSLRSALDRTAAVSPGLKLQQMAVETAEADGLESPQVGDPSIRIRVRDLGIEGEQPELVARARVPLPRPWELVSSRALARATAEREEAQLEQMRRALRLAVTSRFHQLPLLRQAVEVSERLVEAREEHLQVTSLRREEGLSTVLQWLESEEERRDADDARAARMRDLREVEAELRLLLDWPSDDPLELITADIVSRVSRGLPTEEELLEGVLGTTPEIAEARADATRARTRLTRQHARAIPWVDWAQGGLVLQDDSSLAFEVGVAVDIPVFRWTRSRTRSAKLDLDGAELRVADAERRAKERVIRRRRDVVAARDRWEVEREHRAAVTEQVGPLLETEDRLLRSEVAARLARAELREILALRSLTLQVDQLDALRGAAD